MLKSDEIPGYTKLLVAGREAFLKTELDPAELSVSFLNDAINPNSPFTLTVVRSSLFRHYFKIVTISADITIKVEETNQQFDLSLTRSMASSVEWSIRLDSYVDLFHPFTLYFCVVLISTPIETLISAQMKNLFASPTSLSTSSFNALVKVDRRNKSASPFPVLTCSIDVVSHSDSKVYTESKELLCLHSPFFLALFYGDFKEGGVDRCSVHSIDGETFDICNVFSNLLSAMHKNYSPIVYTLILADRFGMERVKEGLERYFVSTELSFLIFFNMDQWIRAAEMANCDKLVDTVVQRANRSTDLLRCYENIHESLSAQTRLKIVKRMHEVATQRKDDENEETAVVPSLPFGRKILKLKTKNSPS